MEFDRRRGHPVLELFDPGGDVDGFDLAQMGDAVGLRPGGEAGRGPGVGAAGVRVPDMGGEELDDAALGVGIGAERARGAVRCRSAPPVMPPWIGGRAAGPRMGQRSFNMYDNVLYHSVPDRPARLPKII